MSTIPSTGHRRTRMRRAVSSIALTAVAAAAISLSAASARAQRFVATADTSFPRIKYPDSLESVNDRCIVRMVKMSRSVRPVYVNGWPIGFC